MTSGGSYLEGHRGSPKPISSMVIFLLVCLFLYGFFYFYVLCFFSFQFCLFLFMLFQLYYKMHN